MTAGAALRMRASQFAGRALPLLALVGATAAAQTDKITLINGDTLTGEIKSLDRGMIHFDTDAADVIPIRWDYVSEIESSESFQITLSTGQRIFGNFGAVSADQSVGLLTEFGQFEVALIDIVRLEPIEGRLSEQIDMAVDLGYSVAKANNVVQTTAGYDFGFRNQQHQVQLVSDLARSSTEDEPDSMRTNVTTSYRRFVDGREWSPIFLALWERNDELGLLRRTTAGGGLSRYLTDTNERQINFLGGFVSSEEDTVDSTESQDSIEVMTGLDIEWFRYESPEFDFSSQLQMFERISGESRTRGNLDLKFKWELVEDFNWGMSIYYSFDSAPEGVDASGTDYGVVATIGWSY
jgi:hypothetical protein